MPHTLRIGTQLWPDDPFWVQVAEAIRLRADEIGVQLVSIDVEHPDRLSEEEQLSYVEELLARRPDALIGWNLSSSLLRHCADVGLPIVLVTETDVRHPRVVSPVGLYDIARQVGPYLAEQLRGRGEVVVVRGIPESPESRQAGIRDGLAPWPEIRLRYLATPWRYERAYPALIEAMRGLSGPLDAIFGFSDSLALAGRDAARALGLLGEHTLIVGINGDPLALAAIAGGSMTATVETHASQLATQALDLAVRLAQGLPVPQHFGYHPRLVTAQNVGEVAARQLAALASLPSRLVGVNRQREQQRLAQLETSLAINRRVGALLDRRRLASEIVELIRANYGYDAVQLFAWDAREQVLTLEQSEGVPGGTRVALADAGILGESVRRNEPIFVPDLHHSRRFEVDPCWMTTRSRVVLPLRLGDEILGLLDLHSRQPAYHSGQDVVGLQLLADQLAIALRNADLYSEAVQARAAAEQADQLKTRLLANVSHELRTPLNVILGYSSAALADPNPYDAALPPALLQDLQRIYGSGEHLIRLINDLLDLSRAEINALDLFKETIDTRAFLCEVFHSVSATIPLADSVGCELDVPVALPLIQADPVRLRQVLMNLLSNAAKFTTSGRITLGAEVAPPNIHLWVADTGAGISIDQQERIFEPFVTGVQSRQRREGVGLGLSITRRLVSLHGGIMALESQPGVGSTFHVYLPLPSLGGATATIPASARPALVLIASQDVPAAPVAELAERRGWTICRLRAGDDIEALLKDVQPVALAWELSRSIPADWSLIQRIRALPQLARLPFILFGQAGQRPDLSVGLTNVLVKPLLGKSLAETIDALRPPPTGTVLIVDDDVEARELYRGIAESTLPDHIIRLADGGAMALAAIDQEPPSLVVLDLMMPDVDGFTVLERLRANPRTRRVPVVVMSGRVLSNEDIHRLDHAYVTFQSKDILSVQETASTLQRARAGDDALPPQTSALVKQAIAYLQRNYASPISRQEIAEAVGVSKDYLSHIFNQELGLSPWEYLNRYRVMRARVLLRETNESVTEIAVRVGFDDLSYFSRVFNKHVGCSPRAYREQGR